MKIIIISAIWCGSCIKMKNVWREISTKYDLDITKLDLDFDSDEVKKYNVGNTLPVAIFLDSNNLKYYNSYRASLYYLKEAAKNNNLQNLVDDYFG